MKIKELQERLGKFAPDMKVILISRDTLVNLENCHIKRVEQDKWVDGIYEDCESPEGEKVLLLW